MSSAAPDRPNDIYPMQPDVTRGFLLSLAGTLAVSTNYVTAKYGMRGFNSQTFSLVWTAAAAFYCFVILAGTGRLKGLIVPRRSVWVVVLLGVCTGVGMLALWAGLRLLDPSFASFLARFASVMTVIFGALFLRERLRPVEFCALGLMIVGGAVSVVGRWLLVGLGTILTLIGCAASATQMLLAKIRSSELHPDVLVFYRVAGAALFISVWTFGAGAADFNVPFRYWAVTCLGAFFGPFTSFLLTFRSYRHWEMSRSAIVRTMEPLFVLPMAYLAFGSLPAGRELIGGLLIMAGAFWIGWMHLVQPARA
jgi:drug/metabolite transporter (DMT)-like permease